MHNLIPCQEIWTIQICWKCRKEMIENGTIQFVFGRKTKFFCFSREKKQQSFDNFTKSQKVISISYIYKINKNLYLYLDIIYNNFWKEPGKARLKIPLVFYNLYNFFSLNQCFVPLKSKIWEECFQLSPPIKTFHL